MKYPPVHYHDYLGLGPLLGAQKRKSEEYGKPARWMLFVRLFIKPMNYGFKQILFELNTVLATFQKKIPETEMGMASARLERIVSILKLIIGQIDIIVKPCLLDFIGFSRHAYPASGFQSYQWRLIETKLGLRIGDQLWLTTKLRF